MQDENSLFPGLRNFTSKRKRSKKPVLIIPILIVATFLLGGCGVTNASSSTPEPVSQTLQSSDEPASLDTTISNSMAFTVPADFPADFPMYADTTSTEITRIDNSAGSSVTGVPNIDFFFSFSGNPDKIYDWYKSELASKGWTITDTSTKDGSVLSADMGDSDKDATTISAQIFNVEGENIYIQVIIMYWN